MNEFRLRPKAISDLDGIWAYTVETWGEEQAERYIRMLNDTFCELATNPSSGRSCDEIRQGYRKSRTGRHVIFYKQATYGIEIVRILHQSMDVDRHL